MIFVMFSGLSKTLLLNSSWKATMDQYQEKYILYILKDFSYDSKRPVLHTSTVYFVILSFNLRPHLIRHFSINDSCVASPFDSPQSVHHSLYRYDHTCPSEFGVQRRWYTPSCSAILFLATSHDPVINKNVYCFHFAIINTRRRFTSLVGSVI